MGCEPGEVPPHTGEARSLSRADSTKESSGDSSHAEGGGTRRLRHSGRDRGSPRRGHASGGHRLDPDRPALPGASSPVSVPDYRVEPRGSGGGSLRRRGRAAAARRSREKGANSRPITCLRQPGGAFLRGSAAWRKRPRPIAALLLSSPTTRNADSSSVSSREPPPASRLKMDAGVAYPLSAPG